MAGYDSQGMTSISKTNLGQPDIVEGEKQKNKMCRGERERDYESKEVLSCFRFCVSEANVREVSM